MDAVAADSEIGILGSDRRYGAARIAADDVAGRHKRIKGARARVFEVPCEEPQGAVRIATIGLTHGDIVSEGPVARTARARTVLARFARIQGKFRLASVRATAGVSI